METINLAPLVKHVSCKEHIISPEIKYKYANEKGDGYLGIIKAVEIVGKNKSLEVIVKYASNSENLRKQAPIREAFLTEMLFYDQLIPAHVSLQIEHNIQNPFVNYPKCYAVCKTNMEEVLLLENLKQHGFMLWDRKKPMNDQHIKFVFSEYGRFHGTNFALKKLKPKVYNNITNQLYDMIGLFNQTEGFSSVINKMVSKVKNIFDPIKEEKYYNIITKFNADPMKKFNSTAELDEYSVILHGDCWCNNMMFKYQNVDKVDKPECIKLIDYQLCKEGAPILDLSYFFYVCADKNGFDKLDEYLEIYHQSLHNHLEQFGLDANDVYPFSQVNNHWKKHGYFGYFMAVFLLKTILGDADEVPDLADIADSSDDGKSIMGSFDFKSRNEEVYKQRLRNIIYHMVDNGMIS